MRCWLSRVLCSGDDYITAKIKLRYQQKQKLHQHCLKCMRGSFCNHEFDFSNRRSNRRVPKRSLKDFKREWQRSGADDDVYVRVNVSSLIWNKFYSDALVWPSVSANRCCRPSFSQQVKQHGTDWSVRRMEPQIMLQMKIGRYHDGCHFGAEITNVLLRSQ